MDKLADIITAIVTRTVKFLCCLFLDADTGHGFAGCEGNAYK